MSNEERAVTKVWIFRKGSGQLRVYPSPVQLTSGQKFTIRNLTQEVATVNFTGGQVKPDKDVSVPGRGEWSQNLTVVAPSGTYFEYDVTANGDYADGGSKPGGFVDP